MSEQPRLPRIRHAEIPDDASLVVRGVEDSEPEMSIRQAILFRRRFDDFGRYGLSAFYARSDDEVLDLAEDRLVAFASLFVFQLDDVTEAGFEVIPTYRSPHVTIVFYDDPHVAVPRLLAVRHRVVENHAFGKEER